MHTFLARLVTAAILAVLVLRSPALHAATVQFAGVVNNDSGSQISQWRTASTPKTLDANGDNLYGSTARLFYTVVFVGEGALYQYNSGDAQVGPFPGYATVDHPTGGADLQVRTTTSGQVGGTDRVMFKFTALAGSPGDVRIGVATDGLDGAFFSPASIGLRQVGGGGSSAEHTLTAVNNTLDMVFFDVRGVQVGDQFEIFGDTGVGGFVTHQFVTWDALPIVVTTAADENNGSTNGTSLREALAAAASAPGPDLITFDPALSGQTINLTSTTNPGSGNTALVIADAGGVAVDASALPGGITLSGAGAAGTYRLIQLTSGSLTLRGLTLANGGGSGFGSYGGGIANNGGALTLDRCTLVGNRVGGGPFGGGAILNNGGALSLTCTHCTFSGNDFTGTADSGSSGGGAINHRASTPATFTHCTFFGNTTNQSGGAILATTGLGTSITLTNTIVAGNTASAGGPDIWTGGAIPTTSGKNLIGNPTNSGLAASTTVIVNASPQLAGLAYYGGGTATMPPLAGSPAIDPSGGDSTSSFATDQRGQPRVVNGIADIGAVEYAAAASALSAVVVNNAAAGLGSLVDTISAVPTGSTITFAPALSGATISPASAITLDKNLTIDGTGLAIAPIISGGGSHRIFKVNAGSTVFLTRLTLQDGAANVGGGIYNFGTLTVNQSTLSGNHADNSFGGGGGIYNDGAGTLTVNQSTLSGNHADGSDIGGGGIYNVGTLTVNQSTLSGNHADNSFGGGGGIHNNGTLTVNQSTLSGNHADNSGGGGGIYIGSSSDNITLTNSLIAGNSITTGTGPDVFNDGTAVTTNGSNFIGILTGSGLSASGTILTTAQNGPANLAPLGNYGGPTQTMALRPGSPARNTATVLVPAITTDQRGFPIVGTPDIGAYEAGNLTNCPSYLAETLPATATAAQIAPGYDFDGDGATNEQEWAALTNPASAASTFRITSAVRSGGNLIITFPSITGRTYTLWQSDTLSGAWTDTGQTAISGNGTPRTFTIPAPGNGVPKRFHRVQVGP